MNSVNRKMFLKLPIIFIIALFSKCSTIFEGAMNEYTLYSVNMFCISLVIVTAYQILTIVYSSLKSNWKFIKLILYRKEYDINNAKL